MTLRARHSIGSKENMGRFEGWAYAVTHISGTSNAGVEPLFQGTTPAERDQTAHTDVHPTMHTFNIMSIAYTQRNASCQLPSSGNWFSNPGWIHLPQEITLSIPSTINCRSVHPSWNHQVTNTSIVVSQEWRCSMTVSCVCVADPTVATAEMQEHGKPQQWGGDV